MDHLYVNTSTNVELEYEIASLGDRILAFLIDFLIILGYWILSSFFLSSLAYYIRMEDYGLAAIVALPPVFYQLICEVFFNGTSPGKKAMKIQVSRLDGREPVLVDYLLRWVMRILEIFACMGAIAMMSIIWDKKGQRLGDRMAGTTVVKLKKRTFFEDTIFREVDENYEVVFPEASLLDEEDVATIADVEREARKFPFNDLVQRLANKARVQVGEKMGVKSSLKDLEFLSQVLNDYNYLQTKE